MKIKRKGKRLKQFIGEILEIMKSHENLGPNIGRKGKSERAIQDSVFSRLNQRLPELVTNHYGYSKKAAKEKVDENFHFENKTTCHVQTFPFFNMNHRPDAEFEINNTTIGFEIKKGKSGAAIRAGIGQSIVYATQFDFVLYFFVDTSKNRDIKNVEEGTRESELISSLWNNYNIVFEII